MDFKYGQQYNTNFISYPILLLFLIGFGLFTFAIYLRCLMGYSFLITIPISVLANYVLFPVIHDGSHCTISSNNQLNEIVSYIAATPFFFAPFPTWRFIHLRHHRHTNIKGKDPDYYVGGEVKTNTELVFRLITHVFQYYIYFFKEVYSTLKKNIRKFCIKDGNCELDIDNLYRVSNDRTIQTNVKILVITAISILLNIVTTYLFYIKGNMTDVLVLWIIPGALGIILLSFLFDYLPHRFYNVDIQESKYKTTNMTHGLFSKNGKVNKCLAILTCNQLTYHNIHHLYPKVPFYVYGEIWDKNKEFLINKGCPIQSVF